MLEQYRKFKNQNFPKKSNGNLEKWTKITHTNWERERVWPMVIQSSDAMVGWQRVGFPPWGGFVIDAL